MAAAATGAIVVAAPVRAPAHGDVARIAMPEEPATVSIWTDGACLGNPGPGGYGVVLLAGPHRKELSAGFVRTTNNRMELLGAVVALETLKRACTVVLASDSKYVIEAMRQGWPQRWQARGWRTADKKPAANVDLWQRLLAVADGHRIDWRWVKGHAGDPENERCDALAMAAARQPERLRDPGYEPSTP